MAATNTIEQAIRDKTPLGEKVSLGRMSHSDFQCVVKAEEKLLAGEELDDVFVGEMILEKLRSSEVYHYGILIMLLMVYKYTSLSDDH